jgi:ACS family hexuronate transporter-like MFS transporter
MGQQGVPGSISTEQGTPPSAFAARPGGSLRWTVCAMLFFATSINYMDRQVLAILSVTLGHSIGWSEAQYGYIISAFQAAYAIGLAVTGWMIDRVGSRIGYAIIMGIWSLAAMAHSLARTALAFGIARFFLGLGESGNFPAALKTTAEWFPQKERSLATGIFNSGANVGATIAPILIPWITIHFGWRYAFLSTGAFSLTWIIVWLTNYRKPADHPRISPQELAYIESNSIASARIPWIRLLGYRQTWAFSIAKFLTDPIWWFFLFWLPKFFDARYHVDLAHLKWPLIVVYNVSMIGSISGGWLPGLLHRRKIPLPRARFLTMLICACMVLPLISIVRLSSLWTAVTLLSLAAAAHQGWSANLLTTASDMFPKSAVGAVAGIGGTAGALGGVLFSVATGWVLELTHSYAVLFAIASSAYLVALGVLRFLVPRLQPVRFEAPGQGIG